jgi:hypothetical protein
MRSLTIFVVALVLTVVAATVGVLSADLSAQAAESRLTLVEPSEQTASFDFQLRQASDAIDKIAAEGYRDGVTPQAGSFDVQLNQAKAKIAQIAEQGQLTSSSFDTQLNAAKRRITVRDSQEQPQR